MMVIEMRDAKERAFGLLEEIKDLGHRKKMALCELEDALYECFESEKEDYEDDEKIDRDYRRSRAYRRRMSKRDHDEDYDDVIPEERYHHNMRMRRY